MLSAKLLEYTSRVKEIYLPYIWNSWGVEPEQLTEAICAMPNKFSKWRMVNNLFIDTEKIGVEIPVWYEYCDTKYQRGNYVHKNQLYETFIKNQKQDQHISVYAHDQRWIDNYKSNGTVSCRDTVVSADWIYLELDRADIDESIKDTYTIISSFPYPEKLRIFFSGNRSVHIAISASLFGFPIGKQENICGTGRLIYNLAHKSAGDCRHGNGILDPWLLPKDMLNEEYSKIYEAVVDEPRKRQLLENIDPNLFRVNSLIRSPFSFHEKTGRQKTLLDILDLKNLSNSETKKLDFDKNSPYLLHWVYECYEPVIKPIKQESIDVPSDLISEIYAKYIPDFDASRAGTSGFVNGLHSPFYEDTKPSVAVNIKSGLYKDFGNPSDTLNLYEFLARINDITVEEAKQTIEELK